LIIYVRSGVLSANSHLKLFDKFPIPKFANYGMQFCFPLYPFTGPQARWVLANGFLNGWFFFPSFKILPMKWTVHGSSVEKGL
jgi:hypothetical protein